MKDQIDGVSFEEFLDRRISEMKGALIKTDDPRERGFWIGRINAYQSIEIIWCGKPDYTVVSLANNGVA